ncbi:ABC transporter permease subunit, partial [Escherichia coli]|nr:ABC transporter permease subunit [Escherichia coli]
RLARGQALVVRQYTYVQAAKTFGASRWHLISWHILRNSLPPLIVQASLDIGSAILMAAVGFNLFGDGIRDLLDPKAGGKQS